MLPLHHHHVADPVLTEQQIALPIMLRDRGGQRSRRRAMPEGSKRILVLISRSTRKLLWLSEGRMPCMWPGRGAPAFGNSERGTVLANASRASLLRHQ